MNRTSILGAAILVAALVQITLDAGQRGGTRTTEPARAATAGEWRYYGGDPGSSKYSPLDQITASNVANLQVAWRWASPDNAMVAANPTARPGGYQDTPLMIGGVVYTVTSLGQLAAIDAGTGKSIWVYDPENWKAGRPTNLGFLHRGLAYWANGDRARILVGTGDAYLLSIDAKTGKPDPGFGDQGRVDLAAEVPRVIRATNYAVSSAPVICRNVVVVGASINDVPMNKEAPPGDISGFDVTTGKRLWTFHSIPHKGEFGHDTWGEGAADYTGNTNVWSLMSADEELGYVYLPFGTPTNDFYGGHRPGNNLFAESLVVLDARSGKRVWHFQGVHHGVWDYDFPAAPNLVEINVRGRRVRAVAQVSKQGFTYVFDRRTGDPIWPIEERPVPPSTVERLSPTQPHPTKPPAFERQGVTEDDLIDFTPELRAEALAILKRFDYGPLFTPPSEKGVIAMPGWQGGANWSGAAFDAETGLLYVTSMMSPIVIQLVTPDPGRSNLKFRRAGVQNLPTIDGLNIFKGPYGSVTAIDLNAGELKWKTALGDGPRNHPRLKGLNLPPLGTEARANAMVTKSLLFVTQAAGAPGRGSESSTIRALDKATGKVLWEFDPTTPGPVTETGQPGPRARQTAPPMTYLHNGKQYIVMAIGGGLNAELVALALR
jgi:quinoprotein glucose dehydrogenase